MSTIMAETEHGASSSNKPQQRACLLLSLPFELREQIWRAYYEDHEIQVRATMSHKEAECIKTHITDRTFAFRITCRQIHEETKKHWKPEAWSWTLFTASQTNVNLFSIFKLLKESQLKPMLHKITKVCITIPMHEAISPYFLNIKKIWSSLRKGLVAVKIIEIMCPGWDNCLTGDDSAVLYNGNAYRYPDYHMYCQHFFDHGFETEFSWPAEQLKLYSLVKDMEWAGRDCQIYLTTFYNFSGSVKRRGPSTSRLQIMGDKKLYHWDSVRFRVSRDSVKRCVSSRHYHEYSREILCQDCGIKRTTAIIS